MKNVLLLKGVTPYDAGATYIEEWASVLRKLGCNTCVLDGWSLAMPGWYSYILSKYKFDLVLDCNGNLMQYGAPDNLPPEVIYATYCHDHPGALERLKYVDERTIVFSLDNRFCSYMDKYLSTENLFLCPAVSIRNVFHMGRERQISFSLEVTEIRKNSGDWPGIKWRNWEQQSADFWKM